MRHNISLIVLAIWTFTASSQTKQTVVLNKFSQKNGLSSYNVRKIIQDKWGFMWIATQDGISRFDGRSFTNYTKNSPVKNRICGTDVRELIEDTSQNLIWVLPAEVGINAINSITGEVIASIRIPVSSEDDWNISMLKNKDELWVGTSTGIRIYHIKEQVFEQHFQLLKKPKSLVEYSVRSIAKDVNGNIWASYDRYGLVIYNADTKKIIKEVKLAELNDHHRSNEIRFLGYVLVNNSILFATDQGLRKISYSKDYHLLVDNTPCHGQPLLNTQSIECISLDKQSYILVSGFNKLHRFDTSLTNFTVLEEPGRIGETDWLNAVQCIYHDAEDNLWLGCQEGTAFLSSKINPFNYYCYDKTNNSRLDHVRSIFPLSNGNILVGLRSGLINIQNHSDKYERIDTNHLYHHIFQDAKGLIHISRPDGMFIFDKGNQIPISKIYPEFQPYSSIAINSHILIGDSLIVLGSENYHGILVWNYRKRKIKSIEQGFGPDSLSSSIVNNIFKDSKNNVWVLSDNMISILSKDFKKKCNLILTEKRTGLLYRLFFDVCEAEGFYWIASYGSGILQLDSSYKIVNVFNTANKLSNDGVYQIHNLTNKRLLITSNNGLSLLDFNLLKFKIFYEADGLHSNGFEEVCGLQKNGLIYAGGLNGFTIIDPSKFSINKSPPILYFTNLQIDKTLNGKPYKTDTTNFKIQTYNIPSNWLQTNISFVGLNYTNPNRVIYQYRILERDTSWININTQNFVNLIGLYPGTYTLEVKAANEDGYWSPVKQLILTFQPKWYQTWWFYTLLTLTVATILYAFFRYRINQIRKQHQIRKDIASDLHDDIGSSLNTVKIFTHLAKKESDKESYLNEIESSLTGAIIGLRDMLWVLNDAQDTAFEMIERVRKFVLPVLEANNIRLDTRVEADEHKPLSKAEKKNLYLIAKESINNSIKYADCKNISLHIHQAHGKTALSIRDDGRGFDTTKQSEGNGLKNIRERARQMRYTVDITSSLDKGTSITLTKT